MIATKTEPDGMGGESVKDGPGRMSRYAAWRSTPDLSKKASLNTIAAGLDYVARTVVELILTPMLVAGLGTYLYGAWRVLWRLTGYLWASSGRSSQALQWALANKQHTADPDEKRRHVGSAILVWFIFLPLLGGIGAACIWAAPHALKAPDRYVADVRLATALLVADAIALTLLTVPRSVLQGENLGYKRMGLSALLVLAQGGLTALALILDTGIVGVAAANIAGTLATGGTFLLVARRHVKWFGVARPARATVKWFIGLSWWFTGWKVLTQLMAGGDLVVLGFFGSVELVTVYALSKFVPEALTALLATIVQAISPGLGGVIGKGEHARAVRVRTELMVITWILVTVAGTGVLVWNASFLGLWVGGGFAPGSLATLLIVVTAAQFVFIRNDATIIDLTLDLRPKVLVGIASTALSLGLAALFASMGGGIVGLCIGLMIGRSILSIAYPWLIGRAIGQPLTDQLGGVLRPALVTALIFGGATYVARDFVVDSWAALVLGSIATAGVVAVIAMTLGLNANQRRGLLRRTRRMLPSPAGGGAR